MPIISIVAKEVLQTTLLRRSFMWRLSSGTECALTFDDGPDPKYTPRILELLDRNQIKASFFVVGKLALEQPQLVRRIVDEGHSVHSHTFTHRAFPTLKLPELKGELRHARDAIRNLTGIDTNLVRPPLGQVNVSSLWHVRKWGFRVVHWTKTYSDYLQDGVVPLLERIKLRGVASRDIMLFHDNNPFTVEALEQLLPEWRGQGHSFVSL